jgi:hypothetical protein
LPALLCSARFVSFVMHRLPLRAIHLVVGLGILALLLRALAAGGGSIIPVSDELGYLSDGLLLLEGLAPGYKHVPNAAINWLVMLTVSLQTVGIWLFGTHEPGVAAILRPLVAMERALFANYADLNGLRSLVLALQVIAGAVAAAATAWRGWSIAGMPGALLGGVLAAATPLFVEFAGETRAYSLAWSLGLLAFATLPAGTSQAATTPHLRTIMAGVLMGLAIAARVEMALALVPLLLELAQRTEAGRRLRSSLGCLGIAVVTFLIVAPWYVTSLAGNLRQIISVRLLTPPEQGGSLLAALGEHALAGMAAPIILVIGGLLIAPTAREAATQGSAGGRPLPSRWFTIAAGLWVALLAAMALKPSIHGLRHDGALLVLVAALAPVALQQFLARSTFQAAPRVVTLLLAALLGLHVIATGTLAAVAAWRAAVQGDPVAWLEQNVPAESTVYWVEGFKVPLPTVGSSERLWAETANPQAWRIKYRHAAERLTLGGQAPRAMSEDSLQLDRALRRRWFILGATGTADPAVDAKRPRYDIHLVAKFGPFAETVGEVLDALCTKGGTYIYIGWPNERLGEPRMRWRPADPSRNSIIIYTIEPPAPGGGRRC